MEGISRVTDLRKLEQRKWKAGDEPPLTSCKHSVGKEQIWTTSAILLTPCHRGRQSSINTGGNFPPNGVKEISGTMAGSKRSRDKFSPYQGPNHGLLSSLSKSLREILAKEKLRSQIEEAVRGKVLGHWRSSFRDHDRICLLYKKRKLSTSVIVCGISPYTFVLGRTAMLKKKVKKVRETSLANTEEVLSCTDAEEKIIVNNKYTE
ncbi:hypothetical protein Tco_1069967 [Tanacetum coccineum]|uniref:Uncharacterized protein n=1 Tax=Tanacetum coccineum TaxID=301880 RepID=A0ABQ5HK36_9ASTR